MPENRIRMLRGIAKLGYADIASRLGVTETSVRRWELGKSGIADDHKIELARLFGVSVPFLMGWPDTENDNGNGVEALAS